MTQRVGAVTPRHTLHAYVPRLVTEWMAGTPEDRHRQILGTMVFVDVSGFTALSERLARRGKAGAEELTEILDNVFAEMLAEASAFGGQLIKFGGDALLLLFDGAGHAARGCVAAATMRTVIETADLRTSTGPVRLRMSVGVHSGAFDFFLVGESHRELMLAGPAASRTVAAEAAADAGEIVLTTDAAEGIGERLTAPRPDGFRLLISPPTAEHRAVAEADDPTVDVALAVPSALRRHLIAGATNAEHRMVTVGFLHLSGVDELLRTRGADAVAEALHQVVTAVQRHVDANSVCLLGSDVSTDGGKLIVVAGVPEAKGNDEERALRALRAVFDEHLPLQVRAGVNRHHVYAGDVGPPERRTFTVMGDAVNLAARLMQAAAAGEILVTSEVLERSATAFELEELPPFTVKGKARPVTALRLGRAVGWRRHQAGQRLPLVGREAEMAVVREALDRAREGRGGVVTMVGPGGIGKSRLAEEVRTTARDMVVLTVLCEQYEAEAAYWPLQWLVRSVMGVPLHVDPDEAGRTLRRTVERVAPDLLPWLPLLAIPAHAAVPATREVEELGDAFRRERLERVTVDLLSRILTTPTLLLIEDLHWMDEASRSLVRRLCAEIAERPWMLALTTRSIDLDFLPEDEDPARVLRLGPLPDEDAHALALAASDLSPLPPHAIEELAQRAGGSPLFLLELVAGAGASGTADLPETIEAAITARIDTLDPADRLVLRCAAVLGIAFAIDLAWATLQEWIPGVRDPDTWDRLDEFLAREAGERLRFRHALVRDVAYEGLPFRRRRVLHALVATRLEELAGEEAEARAEVLSLHFLRAERYEEARKYAVIAGDRARTKAANIDAAGFYRHALDAALASEDAPPDEVAALAERLGDVCELGGVYAEGLRAYRTARRLRASQRAVQADLFRKEGLIQERLGRYTKARVMYTHGLRLAEQSGDEATTARAQVAIAGALQYEGRLRAGLWWAHKAARLAAEHDVLEVLAHAYYLIDFAYTDLGAQAAAKQYRGLALPIYERLGDLVGQVKVLNNLGGNAYLEGEWEEAVRYYQRGLDAAERTGDTVHVAMLSGNIAEVRLQQGQLAEAEVLLGDALQTQRGTGHRIGEAWSLCNLGVIAARSGRLEEAQTLLVQSREKFVEMSADSYALEATARLAETHLLSGDHRRARGLLERALRDVRVRGGLVLEALMRRLEGYALYQAGDEDGAMETLEESLRVGEAANAIYEMALTLEAMGRFGEAAGQPRPEESSRARVLLDDLGVVETPPIPLPPALESRGAAHRPGDEDPVEITPAEE